MLTEMEPGGILRRAVRLLDAAATPHGVDRYIELVVPTWSTSEVRGRVVGTTCQTANTITLTIEANRNWTGHAAGQYTQLTVEIDGVRHTRCYSLANAATSRGDRELELTVKAQPGGVVSNFLVSHARVGMVVWLSPAQGDFVLPDRSPERILFISGGSGITPVISMLRTLCRDGHAGPVTFAHYCLTPADLTYRYELDLLAAAHPNVRVVRVFTDEPGSGDLDGFVNEDQLDTIEREWRSAEAYVCGPAPLMSAVAGIFGAASLSERLHTEAFTLTQFVAEAGGEGGAVRFAGRLGAAASTGSLISDPATTVNSDGRTLLEQAEAAGLRPASGCRMGICHTCVCPLVSGLVRNVVTGDVTSTPGEQVRICVSAPVGDVEIDL